MNSDILAFSIAPRWVTKLLSGEKTVELRRRGPKVIRKGERIVIYETAPTSALVATAIADEIVKANIPELWALVGKDSGCDRDEFNNYFKGCELGSALRLQSVARLARPISFRELQELNWRPPFSWCRVSDQILPV